MDLDDLSHELAYISRRYMDEQVVKIFKGEHPTANPKPRPRKAKQILIEVSIDLYQFLVTDADQNDRSINQSARYWLKKGTGITT